MTTGWDAPTTNTLIEIYTDQEPDVEDVPGSPLHGQIDKKVVLGVQYIGPDGAGEMAFSFTTSFAMTIAEALVEAAHAAFPDDGVDDE